MFDLIQHHQSIALIGMGKNVGKTTVLNHIIKILSPHKKLAITSIGFDGEDLDHIYYTKKPRIEVCPGILFASTMEALNSSTISFELIEKTSIDTAMGPIVIGTTLSNGYLILTGPSKKDDLILVNQQFIRLGAQQILLDGAFGKMMQADHQVADACILATGAAYQKNIHKLVSDTMYVASLFDKTRIYVPNPNHKVMIIDSVITSTIETSLFIPPSVDVVTLHGACTDTFIKQMMKQKIDPKPQIILLSNPTYYFVSEQVAKLAYAKGIHLLFQFIPTLLAITINPLHPSGVLLNKDELKNAFLNATNIPIINVYE